MNTKGTGALCALTAVLALAGCATTQVKSDWNRQIDFGRYRTFAIQGGKVLAPRGSVEAADPNRDTLAAARIEAALTADLMRKGLTPRRDNPDLIVTYTAGARTKEEVVSNWDSFGWHRHRSGYYGPLYQNVWIDQYPEATLVVDLLDPRSQQIVFRSVARADDKDIRNARFIATAVDKALARYPSLTQTGTSSRSVMREGQPAEAVDRIVDDGTARLVGPGANLTIDHGVLAGTLEGGQYYVDISAQAARGRGPLGPIDVQIKRVAGGYDLTGLWNGGRVKFLIGERGARGQLLRQISPEDPGLRACDYDIQKLREKPRYSGLARCLGDPSPRRFDVDPRPIKALTDEENAILLLAYFAAPPPVRTI